MNENIIKNKVGFIVIGIIVIIGIILAIVIPRQIQAKQELEKEYKVKILTTVYSNFRDAKIVNEMWEGKNYRVILEVEDKNGNVTDGGIVIDTKKNKIVETYGLELKTVLQRVSL